MADVRERTRRPAWARRRRILLPLIAAFAALAVLEVGLRLVPSAIPATLLENFRIDVRHPIEAGQTLFAADRFVEIARDDGGPTLRAFAPGTVHWRPHDASDRAFGAVDTIVTDETGFCNQPTRPWSLDDVDIVAIGDSFTWCTSVAPEEAWPVRLEPLVGRPTYNLGRPGIGIYEAVQILKAYGLQRRPRIVVLTVYEGNDVREAYYYWRSRVAAEPAAAHPALPAPEQLGERSTEPPTGSWWQRLRRTVAGLIHETPLGRSYLVNLGLAGQRLLASANPPSGNDLRYSIQLDDQTIDFSSPTAAIELSTARAVADGDLSPGLLDAGLAAFADLARHAGFWGLVTYVPSAYTAYEGRTSFRADGVAEVVHRFSQAQRRWLSEAADRHGLAYLDLTPPLQEAAASGSELLYFPRNQHLTAAGHRVVAAYLAEALRGAAPDATKRYVVSRTPPQAGDATDWGP